MDCSDKKMRTLGEALQTDRFSDEALAFVNGSRGKPAKKTIPVPDAAQDSHAIEKIATKSNTVRVEPPQESSIPVVSTISMTFRLPSELSSRLMRASVERKLKRQRPFSQQDIIAEALAKWLDKNS